MKIVMRTLSEYLKQKRIESGLSQLAVARELGYASPQFVSNWERGLVSPPLETIGVLIDMYRISPKEMIERILNETRQHLESQLLRRNRKVKKNTKRTRPGERRGARDHRRLNGLPSGRSSRLMISAGASSLRTD